jgi:hypothetical protein
MPRHHDISGPQPSGPRSGATARRAVVADRQGDAEEPFGRALPERTHAATSPRSRSSAGSRGQSRRARRPTRHEPAAWNSALPLRPPPCALDCFGSGISGRRTVRSNHATISAERLVFGRTAVASAQGSFPTFVCANSPGAPWTSSSVPIRSVARPCGASSDGPRSATCGVRGSPPRPARRCGPASAATGGRFASCRKPGRAGDGGARRARRVGRRGLPAPHASTAIGAVSLVLDAGAPRAPSPVSPTARRSAHSHHEAGAGNVARAPGSPTAKWKLDG